MQFDIYDNAAYKEFLYIPNKNAFSQYDKILNKILQYDKSTLIVLMAGPTASVLASDLSTYGYRALDLGHLAKGYDYYKRQIPYNDETLREFFAPDE